MRIASSSAVLWLALVRLSVSEMLTSNSQDWWRAVACARCVQEACSFSGAWRGKPSSMARVYYVSSYFWDRALDSGIISDPKAISWKTSPGVSNTDGKQLAVLAGICGSRCLLCRLCKAQLTACLSCLSTCQFVFWENMCVY